MSLSLTKITETDEDVAVSNRTRNAERDEDQQARDADVAELKTAWEQAGKPSLEVLHTDAGFRTAKRTAYGVNKDDRTEVKRQLRRAATLHKVSIVFAQDKTLADGKVRVMFTVGPVPPKVEQSAEPPAGQASEPPANPAADQENPGESHGRRGLIGGRR